MPYSEQLDSCQEYQIWQQGEVTWEQGPILEFYDSRTLVNTNMNTSEYKYLPDVNDVIDTADLSSLYT